MIQAIGLTSRPQDANSDAESDTGSGAATVRGLTFEAAPGEVTVLLGDPGAGKTAAVRRLLQLDPGRGTALFNGRPLSRIAVPAREVGTVLGDVAGHPARTLRAHLRMLAAAIGVPATRADDVLELVGLDALAGDRLDTLALGMDRRLGLATALLGDPHTLVLDDPARDLSHREAAWYHATLRELAGTGICVFTTTTEPRTAARLADRVLSLDAGRIVADQPAAEFARTRLRSCVTVRTPQAERLATYLARTTCGRWAVGRILPGESSDSRARSPLAGTGIPDGAILTHV
ncbi:ATP-binding cassette domain-containing protein, partial [Streptomyces sp. A7024]